MMDAQKIIIIHPGSQNLRIGRASDLNPTTFLHAIAFKNKNNLDSSNNLPHHDPLLPLLLDDEETVKSFEEHRLDVSLTLQNYVHKPDENGRGGNKRQRLATPLQQIIDFNKRTEPEIIKSDLVEIKVDEEKPKKNILFDAEISNLTANESRNYYIHFPMRRGELNIHSGVGGSKTAVFSYLELIWLNALEKKLNISPTRLSQYCCALVIPDIYNRNHLRELVNLLLHRMKFRACFLLQDHVAATFGSGLGYGCVVDVGDQKCSISCVEDGISHQDTRVRLGYGGGDVTQIFQKLFQNCYFPYKECDFSGLDYSDATLLQLLKESFCHINMQISGVQEKTFEVKKFKGKICRYTMQLGDECIIAPLSFFHTELFSITGRNRSVMTQLPCSQQTDPEDCFNAEYIRETGRRNGRDPLLEGSMLPITGDAPDDELVVDSYEVTEKEIVTKNSDKDDLLYYTSNGSVVSLDQAIIRSIERCSSEEIKRKMFGNILLVGGSIKFPGLCKYLENKIKLVLSQSVNRLTEQAPYDISVFTKELDATIVAWKGAAIMSCLESANELWINSAEWEKAGLRVLREKAPFMW